MNGDAVMDIWRPQTARTRVTWNFNDEKSRRMPERHPKPPEPAKQETASATAECDNAETEN